MGAGFEGLVRAGLAGGRGEAASVNLLLLLLVLLLLLFLGVRLSPLPREQQLPIGSAGE